MIRVQPPISVGMPVYNGEKYLQNTIDCILNQTYSDFELLISDNASDDKTQEICQEYARADSRIRYIRQPSNIGGSRNWNLVFQESRGIYFKWASANDICSLDLLERCKQVLDARTDVILCYGRAVLIDEMGASIREYKDRLDIQDDLPSKRFKKLLLNIGLNNAQAGLFRSSTLRSTALEGLYRGGDITLMAELSLYGKFFEIPAILYQRRIAPDASTMAMTDEEHKKFHALKLRGRPERYRWKFHQGCLSAILRAPIEYREKAKTLAFLLKTMFWAKHDLTRELLG